MVGFSAPHVLPNLGTRSNWLRAAAQHVPGLALACQLDRTAGRSPASTVLYSTLRDTYYSIHCRRQEKPGLQNISGTREFGISASGLARPTRPVGRPERGRALLNQRCERALRYCQPLAEPRPNPHRAKYLVNT